MSKIEWTEKTWNPIVGCSIVSPGCTNCYAMRMAARLETMSIDRYAGLTKIVNDVPVWTGEVAIAPDATFLMPLNASGQPHGSSTRCPTYSTRASLTP